MHKAESNLLIWFHKKFRKKWKKSSKMHHEAPCVWFLLSVWMYGMYTVIRHSCPRMVEAPTTPTFNLYITQFIFFVPMNVFFHKFHFITVFAFVLYGKKRHHYLPDLWISSAFVFLVDGVVVITLFLLRNTFSWGFLWLQGILFWSLSERSIIDSCY